MNGWVKLHRQFLKWEWYDDINASRLFLHLILTANHKNKKWQGITIKRGQLATSLSSLSKGTKLTVKQIRTALTKLKTTNEVAVKTTSRYSLITVVNYSLYQSIDDIGASKGASTQTNEGQAKGKQRATNKKDKKDKNVKKEEIYIGRDFSSEIISHIDDWLAYKDEKRQSYKSTGLKSLLTQIENNITAHGEKAVIHAITESMASNYQGIVWDKAKHFGGNRNGRIYESDEHTSKDSKSEWEPLGTIL